MVDDPAIGFLRLILPDCGHYAATIKNSNTGRFENVFASSIEELWILIKEADQAGHTAYHACATFKEARHDPRRTPRASRQFGRTKRNAFGAKAFWCEIDAGTNKPYAEWRVAISAVAEFCETTGLPQPLLVLSGLGLHVYWPLNRTLDRDTWERYARGLKALCVKHQLRADPARTADITSVLRTPGTHHRKAGIRLVQCSPLVGPYDLAQFAILLSVVGEATPKASNAKPKASNIVSELGPIPPHLANPPVEGVKEKLHRSLRSTFEPSLGTLVAEQCEQVRALRDKKGNLSEPLWYACLGVLAFADDGEQLAHEWSSGDQRYIEQETQERLDRARQFGPTTCKKFHELNPTVCESCSWFQKIKSPIVLGREYCGTGNRDQQSPGGEDANSAEQDSDCACSDCSSQDSWGSANGGTARAEQQRNYANEGSGLFPLRWHGEGDPHIKREWLVKQMLPKTGVGLISGQWGTAKTFIALDLAASVMMGTKFAGRPVKRRGGVLFLAAEGSSEIPIRLWGLVEAKFPEQKDRLPFAWVEGCPTLMQAGATEQLVQIAKQAADRMQSEFGVELALIIVDTMSAAAGFKDENSSPEGQLAMNVLNELSKRTGAFAIACDHFGKMVETGTRGTSAKEASADVVIACLGDRTQAGSLANLRIAVRKLRGGATGGETAIRLRTVDMGVDEDREPITTCVVEWSTVTVAAPPDSTKGKGWPKSTILFRGALVTTLKLHGMDQQVPPGGSTVFAVELDKVREEFDKRYPLDGGDRQKQLGKRRQAFKRSMATAQSNGMVGGREIDGKFLVWLTRPEDEGVMPPRAASGQEAA